MDDVYEQSIIIYATKLQIASLLLFKQRNYYGREVTIFQNWMIGLATDDDESGKILDK